MLNKCPFSHVFGLHIVDCGILFMHEDGRCECVLSLPTKRVGYGWSCVAILFESFMRIAAKSRIFAVTVCSCTQLYGKKSVAAKHRKYWGFGGQKACAGSKKGAGRGGRFQPRGPGGSTHRIFWSKSCNRQRTPGTRH